MVLYVVYSAKKFSNLVNDELNSVPLSHILTKFYWEYFFRAYCIYQYMPRLAILVHLDILYIKKIFSLI